MTRRTLDLEETIGDARDVAAGWFARQRSGALTEADRRALERWLDAAPEHRRAYDSVQRAWTGAGALRADPQVLEIRERWAGARRSRRWFPGGPAAAAAAAVVVALAGGGVFGWRAWTGPHPLKDQSFRTAVGERSTIELPDGSELILNTDTVVRTRADRDRRLVYLERGQAYFRVAKDPERPFVVAAGGKTVTALGTAFDVRVDGKTVRVTLIEGRVRVEAPLSPPPSSNLARKAPGAAPAGPTSVQAMDMTAGSRLVAPTQAAWQVAQANVVVETSWTHGQLIFDDASLGTAVAELNRYSTKKILIADPAIANTPISGVFRPGDVDSFVRTLQAYRLARAGENTPEAVHLRAY